MAGRVFVNEDPRGPQIREFRIAVVPQKQSPSAIADKYQRIMRNLEIHNFSGVCDGRAAYPATHNTSFGLF